MFKEIQFKMSSRDDSPNHLLVVQLNADLRSAQLDLLSARCATDRLRLRFSPEDMARLGDRHILLKAASSANALHDFYKTIEKAMQSADSAASETDVSQTP